MIKSVMTLDGGCVRPDNELKWSDCVVVQTYIDCQGCSTEAQFRNVAKIVRVDGVDVKID